MVAAMASLSFSGCRGTVSHPQTKLTVATGMAPVGSIIKEIGGDSVDVEILLSTGQDPEQFDPGTSTMKALSRSRLFFTLSVLPFEQKIAENLHSDTDMVSLTDSVNLVYGSHGSEPDPHVWMSLRNQKIMARNVARALTEASPGAANYFAQRLNAFEHRIDSLDAAWNSELSAVKSRAFVIAHPSLTYFARDYGLTQIATVADGHKEQSAQQLRKQIDKAVAEGAAVFFSQPGSEGRMADELAGSIGATVVAIDPMAPDAISQCAAAVDALFSKQQ